MSYDCTILDEKTKKPIELKENHYIIGGTYALGGTKELYLNVTYNYSQFFGANIPGGIRSMNGMKASDSICIIQNAIEKMSGDIDEDYWKPTEGNAKKALEDMLALAKLAPEGIWEIE